MCKFPDKLDERWAREYAEIVALSDKLRNDSAVASKRSWKLDDAIYHVRLGINPWARVKLQGVAAELTDKVAIDTTAADLTGALAAILDDIGTLP